MLTVLGALILWLVNGCSCVFYGCDDNYAYAVTAAHCVGAVDSTVDCQHNGKTFGCRVIAVDRDRDLALLKADKVHVGDVNCPIVNAHDGDELLLIGFPKGVKHATTGTLTSKVVKGTRSHFVANAEGIQGGISGGGVFASEGLVGVVTHSAEVDGVKGAGCSIVDRIIDRQTDRVVAKGEAAVEDVTHVGLRELIILVVGWLSRFYFPGGSMLTAAQHKEKLDSVKVS
jgi:S1-C subfamily serine protease